MNAISIHPIFCFFLLVKHFKFFTIIHNLKNYDCYHHVINIAKSDRAYDDYYFFFYFLVS